MGREAGVRRCFFLHSYLLLEVTYPRIHTGIRNNNNNKLEDVHIHSIQPLSTTLLVKRYRLHLAALRDGTCNRIDYFIPLVFLTYL